MVIVSNYKKVKNADEEEFCMLVLTGDPVLVKSKSGKTYFTARTANVASTFSEEVCKSMIGKKMPGNIIKQECEPYDYSPPNSDDIIELDYTWVYSQEESSMEEAVEMDSLLS